MDPHLLVLGPGFVGAAVADAAAARMSPERVTVLGRRPRPDEPVAHVAGDARRGDLGLDETRAAALRWSTTHIVIAVGGVSFDLTPSEAAADHVAPVRGAVAFAAQCPNLKRVVLVSSALAAGAQSGRLRSSTAAPAGSHRNFYEWAKQRAERVASDADLAVAVVRPGHVFNSSDGTRSTPYPIGIFELLPLIAARWPLPIDPDTPYPCAPVDLVAETVVATLFDPSVTATWCIHPAMPTVGELLDVIAMRHGLGTKRIPSRRLGGAVAALMRPRWVGVDFSRGLLPYLTATWHFDLSCQEAVLARAGVPIPDRSFVAATVDHEVHRLASLA